MANYSLYNHGVAPTLDTGDSVDTALTLGTVFTSSTNGSITSVWVYVGNTNLGGQSGTALVYPGNSWADVPQTLLSQQAFTYQGTVGWQEVVLSTPVTVTAGQRYMAAAHFPTGHYSSTASYFQAELIVSPLTALAGTSNGMYDIGNGRYIYGASPAYPQNRSSSFTNYWLDVTFSSNTPPPDSGIGIDLSATNSSPNVASATSLTATASGGTNYGYTWEIESGSGTFGTPSAMTTTYTPSAFGKQIIRCTVTATEGAAVAYITLDVGVALSTTNTSFSATVTDALGLQDSDTQNAAIGRAGTAKYHRRSLLGNRLSFGDPVVNTGGVIQAVDDSPATFSIKIYLQRNCSLLGLRFLKRGEATGDYVFAVWRVGNTSPLVTKTVTFVSDNARWVTINFDVPLALTASDTVPYIFGFYSPDGKLYFIPNGFGSQDVLEYPFYIKFNNGGFNNEEATGYNYGSQLTFPNHWTGGNYCIDPIVEWQADDVVYEGGLEYYKRFSASANTGHFPIAIWQPLAESIPNIGAVGMNTIMVMGQGNFEGGMAATIAAGLDVYPEVAVDDYATLAQIEANPAFSALVRGFLIADEPDMVPPWRSPTYLRNWYIELRKRDASKLILFNLGKWPVINRGFAHLPTGATMKEANNYWRDFAHLSDIVCCDFYMEDSRNLEGIYGLWCNPRMVKRLGDLSDNSRPIWHIIASAATPDNQPSPDLVYKSTWASLIGGARGLIFFDYTFTNSGAFVSDFSMGSNAPMAAMMQSLTARIQSLKNALLGPEATMDVSIASSNVTEGPVGGEFGVPIHYAARIDGSNKYLFTQSIRPGTTTATFTVPAAANKTITVIDESRTINANGSGVFTDNFATDYEVHLYQWT